MSLVKNITKKSYNDRLNTTIFYINIFLILVHVFLSVFYMLAHHNLMIIVNLFSIILYLVSFLFCFKHKKAYLNIAFVEIWIHMLLSFCSFGWEACFQNWIFALVAAVFLPAFSPEHKTQSYKQSYIFSFIIVLSYFIFAWITNTFDLIITIKLETYLQNTLFFFNNMVAFLSIILFAVTYTKNKESKEFELIRKANFDEDGIFLGWSDSYGSDVSMYPFYKILQLESGSSVEISTPLQKGIDQLKDVSKKTVSLLSCDGISFDNNSKDESQSCKVPISSKSSVILYHVINDYYQVIEQESSN